MKCPHIAKTYGDGQMHDPDCFVAIFLFPSTDVTCSSAQCIVGSGEQLARVVLCVKLAHGLCILAFDSKVEQTEVCEQL